jgi:hypothetical protein
MRTRSISRTSDVRLSERFDEPWTPDLREFFRKRARFCSSVRPVLSDNAFRYWLGEVILRDHHNVSKEDGSTTHGYQNEPLA